MAKNILVVYKLLHYKMYVAQNDIEFQINMNLK